MVCKNVKDVVKGYETIIELIIVMCTDRACTLDYIQKSLAKQEFTLAEDVLTALMSQIKEMMIFAKDYSYDVGDIVTYRRFWLFGKIVRDEKLGNEIVHIEYKKFYLYNNKRFTDDAFREHIFPKLEFEEIRRTPVKCSEDLQKALICLNIERDKWKNYVSVDDKGRVLRKGWNPMENTYTEFVGKLVKRTPINVTNNTNDKLIADYPWGEVVKTFNKREEYK